MYDKFPYSPLFTYSLYEMYNIIPRVPVINSESAFHCDRYVDLLYHCLAHSCDQMRVEHQLGSETARDCFIGRAAAVQVHFVKPIFFDHLRSLCSFDRIVTTNLSHYWVLLAVESQDTILLLLVHMDYSVFV